MRACASPNANGSRPASGRPGRMRRQLEIGGEERRQSVGPGNARPRGHALCIAVAGLDRECAGLTALSKAWCNSLPILALRPSAMNGTPRSSAGSICTFSGKGWSTRSDAGSCAQSGTAWVQHAQIPSAPNLRRRAERPAVTGLPISILQAAPCSAEGGSKAISLPNRHPENTIARPIEPAGLLGNFCHGRVVIDDRK